MLTGPRTACSKPRCEGVATRLPCFARQLVGRINKSFPFKPSPVLRLIAHQAKPARTTAPRLAAHPFTRQISTVGRYSSTEQGSSAQMEGSGQGPVLKVRGSQHALSTCAGTSLCLVLTRMWCFWVVVTVMWRFCGDLAWTPCQGCGSPSSPRMYIPHTGILCSKIYDWNQHAIPMQNLCYLCFCSGMLPGLVAGFYTFDECHIDLAQLCTFASARMIHAEAIGIDKQVGCLTQPA